MRHWLYLVNKNVCSTNVLNNNNDNDLSTSLPDVNEINLKFYWIKDMIFTKNLRE